MKNKINLKLNNKGSGIVTVLVAVGFLILMGSLLLMLTYTGFEMKTSDRKGKQNTYDASTAMDEIRLGFQKIVSDTISESYTNVMSNYTRYAQEGLTIQTEFANRFKEKLESAKIDGENLVVNKGGSSYEYRVAALESMIKNCRNGTVDLSQSGCGMLFENGKITFKDIKLKYTSVDRTTVITTDIVLTAPDIGYSFTQFSISGVPSFSSVIGGNIVGDATSINTDVTINGNAYMNSADLSSFNSLTLNNGIFVSRGNIDIYGNGTESNNLAVDENSTLWAENIILHNNAKASLLGYTFVANDLDMVGSEAAVKLSGTYNGFGTGGEDGKDASKSSAILANGKSCSLDISGLEELTLAGISFIGETNDGYGAANVQMGESMSVRENQRVYLVPEEYLSFVSSGSSSGSRTAMANPEIFIGENDGVQYSDGAYSVVENGKTYKLSLKNDTLWTIDGEPKKFSSYNAQIQPVTTLVSGRKIVYYFLKFGETKTGDKLKYSSEENADRYFRDYAAANPEAIKKYVEKYLDINNSSVAAQTLGNFFTGMDISGQRVISFKDYLSNSMAAGVKANAAQDAAAYKNVCQTLSYDVSSEVENDNPFTYYVNEEKIKDKISDGEYKAFTNNEITAIIANGDYTYDGSDSTIKLIIATGKITLKKDYNGLIMCGGDLIVSQGSGTELNIISDSRQVEKAYAATAEFGSDKLRAGDFFKVPIGSSNDWSAEAKGTIKSVSGLVTYSNWKKD